MTHLYVHHEFKPVGQGLFAFGEVEFRKVPKGRRRLNIGQPPDWKFTWVYDCGTSSGQALTKRGIQEIRERLKNSLDLVVISHLHSDHISGLLELLRTVGTTTIMFPWAPLWQRLVIGFEQGLEANDPVMAFYVDPVGYLVGEAGDNFEYVVFVLPSGGGDAPDPDEPGPGLDPLDFGPHEDSKDRARYEKVSRKAARLEVPDTHENDFRMVVMSPAERLIRGGAWEFLPYNDPKSAPGSPDFLMNAVSKLSETLLNGTREEREVALSSLKKLYLREFPTGFQNDLSLNLYTGPVPLSKFLAVPKVENESIQLQESRLPILYSGDGNYSSKPRRDRLARHLGSKRREAVSTYQVPHHGSKHNWSKGLAPFIAPKQSVFTADPNGRYGHPHAEVWREFLPYGPQMVDKHSRLKWDEHLQPKK